MLFLLSPLNDYRFPFAFRTTNELKNFGLDVNNLVLLTRHDDKPMKIVAVVVVDSY